MVDNVLKEPGQSEAVLINRAKVRINVHLESLAFLTFFVPRLFSSLVPFSSLRCRTNPTKNVASLNGTLLVSCDVFYEI